RFPARRSSDLEGADLPAAGGHFAQTAHGYIERTGDRYRGEFMHAGIALVGNDFGPARTLADDIGNFIHGNVFLQLDRQCLTVATHGANTYAQAIDRRDSLAERFAASKNLVGLGLGFPLFTRHAVTQVFVDPGNQVATQRYAKVLLRQAGILLRLEDAAIDFKNGRCRVVEQRLDLTVQQA